MGGGQAVRDTDRERQRHSQLERETDRQADTERCRQRQTEIDKGTDIARWQ